MTEIQQPRIRAVLSEGPRLGDLVFAWQSSTSHHSQQQGIQSVEFAFAILAHIELFSAGIPLKQLAKRLESQPSKVHHYLVSLTRSGAVEQVANGSYRLGPFAVQLGFSALAQLGNPDVLVARLGQLRDRTCESAFLAAWSQRGPTILHRVHGQHMLTVDVEVGLVLPLRTSSTGRCFMAFLDAVEWGRLANAEAKFRPDIDQREQDDFIAKARAEGFVTVEGSFHPRIAALSAPVWGRDGKLIHVMTVLGWVDELDAGSAARALLEESGSLSGLMGYRP